MTYPSSGSHADLFIYLDRSEAAHKRRGYGRNVGRRTVVERSNCSRTAVESQSNRSCNYCFSIHYSTAVLLLVRARKPGNGLSDAAELVGPELSPTSLQAPKAGGTMHMRIERNVSHRHGWELIRLYGTLSWGRVEPSSIKLAHTPACHQCCR